MTEARWIEIGSIAGVVTALFTAVMSIAVVVTAVYAQRTLRAAREDSRARSRPALAAFFDRELLSHGTVLLVIKNFGQSSAADVHVTFDPPAPAAQTIEELPNSDLFKWLYQRFAAAVPVWPPGWATSNVVRAGQDHLDPFIVVLNYNGPDGTPYSERFPLHPGHVLRETTSTPSKTDDPITLAQQGVAALQALVRGLRGL